MIAEIKFENFTAFKKLRIEFSAGINIFVGSNGTGKTHILKTVYASCDITKSKKNFAEKILRVFMPSASQLGRLVKRQKVSARGSVEVFRSGPGLLDTGKLRLSFSNHATKIKSATIIGANNWCAIPIESVFIPVKEMLSNAPGFRSMYGSREVHFEEVYADIIDRALLPLMRGPADRDRKKILSHLQKTMEGKVTVKNEEFFLRNIQGNLEFSLLAEGIRKLGLLWVLIQNGTLLKGTVFCWDEPEANLNPKLLRNIVEILLSLQRMGVQIFIATHDYVLLKEFDLQKQDNDKVKFHSLYRDEETKEIKGHHTEDYLQIHPNTIQDTFIDLFDRDVKRDMEL
jgi:predicted ATPase